MIPALLHLEIDQHPSDADMRSLSETLFRWNMETSGADDFRPFAVWIRDSSGGIVGGAAGWSRWEWAHLETLWIEPEHRGCGHGSKLLAMAESVARGRGCRLIDLETFSFQAPDFYARHGWAEVWVLDGIAHGIRRHHFRKDLAGHVDA